MLISDIQRCRSVIGIPSLWALPAALLGQSQSSGLGPCATSFQFGLCGSWGVRQGHFLSVASLPPCPQAHLYICVSIPSLQTGPSVPFSRFQTHPLTRKYLFSSFWLTSICLLGPRLTHSLQVAQMRSSWMAEKCFTVRPPRLLHPSYWLCGVCCFHVLAVVKSATMNTFANVTQDA